MQGWVGFDLEAKDEIGAGIAGADGVSWPQSAARARVQRGAVSGSSRMSNCGAGGCRRRR